MNITSTVVSACMMGTLLPGITSMSLAPVVAGKRAVHFTQAEALAVSIAADSERANVAPDVADLPTGCTYTKQKDPVYTVECRAGVGTAFEQAVAHEVWGRALAGHPVPDLRQ